MTQYSLSLRDPGYITEDSMASHMYEIMARKGEESMGEDISFYLKLDIDKEKLQEYQTTLTTVFGDLIEEGMISRTPVTTQIRYRENWLEQIVKGYSQIPSLLARTKEYGVSMTLDLESGALNLTLKTYNKDMRTVKNVEIINNVPIEYETIMQAYKVGKEKLKIN